MQIINNEQEFRDYMRPYLGESLTKFPKEYPCILYTRIYEGFYNMGDSREFEICYFPKEELTPMEAFYRGLLSCLEVF